MEYLKWNFSGSLDFSQKADGIFLSVPVKAV